MILEHVTYVHQYLETLHTPVNRRTFQTKSNNLLPPHTLTHTHTPHTHTHIHTHTPTHTLSTHTLHTHTHIAARVYVSSRQAGSRDAHSMAASE